MRRADRRDESDDNAVRRPHSRQPEPISYHELKSRLATVRAQRDEWQQCAQEKEKQAEQHQQLYLEEQQKHQATIVLYQEVQTQAQSYLTLYNTEKARSSELLVKYEEAQTQREHYLTLYNEAQNQLKFERRSKAGIKSWETRRKRENERLKQEIAEMSILLRDSLERKHEAVNTLYALADRMDRIQQLVDSVEEESSNSPVSLLQKLKRIWQAIKEILSEEI